MCLPNPGRGRTHGFAPTDSVPCLCESIVLHYVKDEAKQSPDSGSGPGIPLYSPSPKEEERDPPFRKGGKGDFARHSAVSRLRSAVSGPPSARHTGRLLRLAAAVRRAAMVSQ